MPVLDANLLIRLDHDDAKAVAAIDRLEGEMLVVPYQAAFEYAAGTRDPEASIVAVAGAFVLDAPTSATLATASSLVAAARRRGHRVDSADAWIAASAVLRDDYVVTSNKRDFRRLDVPAWNYMRERSPP